MPLFLLVALHVFEITAGPAVQARLDMLDVRTDPVVPSQMRSVFLNLMISTEVLDMANRSCAAKGRRQGALEEGGGEEGGK